MAKKKIAKVTKKKAPTKEQQAFMSTGLVFAGCLFIGLGLDFIIKTMPAGIIIGMGVGFILMFWLKNEKK